MNLKNRNNNIILEASSGATTKELAQKYNLSMRSIQKILKEARISPRKENKVCNYKRSPNQDKEKRNIQIINELKNKSVKEVANKYNLSVRTIQLIMKKHSFKCLIKEKKLSKRAYKVYLIEFSQNQNIVYIGVTSDVRKRMLVHKSSARNLKHSSYWINEQVRLNKYNEIEQKIDEFKILETTENITIKEALAIEKKWRIFYKKKGFNLLGGSEDFISIKKSP